MNSADDDEQYWESVDLCVCWSQHHLPGRTRDPGRVWVSNHHDYPSVFSRPVSGALRLRGHRRPHPFL